MSSQLFGRDARGRDVDDASLGGRDECANVLVRVHSRAPAGEEGETRARRHGARVVVCVDANKI